MCETNLTPKQSKTHRLRAAVNKSRSTKASSAQYRQQDGPFRDTAGGVGFSKFYNSLFPLRMRKSMTYSESTQLTAGASSLFGTAKKYRLNSIYDPDASGIGDYPYGYSAISAIYANYRVYGVTIDILATDPSADAILVGTNLSVSNSFTTINGLTADLVDKKNTADVRALMNTGMQSVRIQRKFSIAELEGIPYAEWIANPNYSSTVGGNPSATPFLEVAIMAVNGTPTADIVVRLTFDVEFFGRIPQ